METHFASPERAADNELKLTVEILSKNPVVDGLLDVVGGLVAVLNEHRQILALNETLLSMLGVDNPRDVLGLRPGEALGCIHANEMPGGCGTSRFCATCGAAIAIVASQGQDRPVEKTCALTVKRNDREMDLYLSVRSCPIRVNGERLLLLFIQDITRQQQRAVVERVFFHDINNILTGLCSTSELLRAETEGQAHTLATGVHQLAVRLVQEVKIQQYLTQIDMQVYRPVLSEVSTRQVLDEVRRMFDNHPVAKGKVLNLSELHIDISLKTDVALFVRVLGNMLTNAFEATAPGEEVKLWIKKTEGRIGFYVWNKQSIPAGIAARIFQRNFSTKQESGRGLGTYSMKLFGEQFLGGTVAFTSTEADGTTFCFMVPI